jgi:hypothetical protein
MAQTSSLAEWFDTDEGATGLDEIDAPVVLATPASVVAHGLNNTVMVVHMDEGFLAFAGTDDELVTEDRFTLDCLACLVWQLPRLVMACSDTQEHEEELAFQSEEGITCERIAPGVLALGTIADDSVKIHLPPGIAWQLVAELTALMVRRIAHTANTMDQLEAALEQSN